MTWIQALIRGFQSISIYPQRQAQPYRYRARPDFLDTLQQAYAGYADGVTDPTPPPRDQRRKGSSVRPSQRP